MKQNQSMMSPFYTDNKISTEMMTDSEKGNPICPHYRKNNYKQVKTTPVYKTSCFKQSEERTTERMRNELSQIFPFDIFP